jgi:signal transduction histidine kinase
MKLQLGLPQGHSVLGSRLATLTLLRLVFLSVLLGILGRWHLRDIQLRAFSVQVALVALGIAFALAAGYGIVLRSGRYYRELAWVQLVFDQATWTALVYVSGGATSGATSLYGLTVLTGAVIGGLGAASIAAAVGFTLYVLLSLFMVAGWVPVPPDQLDVPYPITLDQVASPLAINLLVVVVVTLLSGYLAERLRLAGGKLEEATVRALQAERLAYLGKIAAGLAHEIRNPLGSISASIELLRDAPALSDDDRRLCDIIRGESSRLNDLVGDMLDLARPRKPDLVETDIASAAREVATLAQRSGRGAKDVRVRIELPEGVSSFPIHADPAQLRQLIWNLVRNAVQATAPDTVVTLRVKVQDRNSVIFEVEDAGAGIAEEARPHLFEAFFTTRVQGAGIGLAVVKRIVDDHGWEVEALGNEAGGTTFRVAIPLGES